MYQLDSERERWDALQRMTAAESIALGEALLTSEIMLHAKYINDDHPRSLAIALGIDSIDRMQGGCTDGSKSV